VVGEVAFDDPAAPLTVLENTRFRPGETTNDDGYARELADFVSPRSMAVIKRQLWQAQFQGLADATAVADDEMRKSFGAEDFKEGVAHFLEKRAPRFTGR